MNRPLWKFRRRDARRQRKSRRLRPLAVERLEERRLLSAAPLVEDVQPRAGAHMAPLEANISISFDQDIELAANEGTKVISKVIPLRFVEVHPFFQTLEPYLDRETILATVDAVNEAFADAGLKFWTKSVERLYSVYLANEALPVETTISYAQARIEFQPVFSIPEMDPAPADRTPRAWVGYMSTVFSDPSELLVWVFSADSVVARAIGGSSSALFPNGGRSVIMTAERIFNPNSTPSLSPYHLAHELGHFFGNRHTWAGPHGTNPYTGQPIDWPDLWDLIFQREMVFPTFFSSRSEVEAASGPFEVIETWDPINLHVDNRYGADQSDMEGVIAGVTFHSGDDGLKGLSFDLGTPENPPDSFAWGVNAMGYWGRYNAHLWTPGRFSASQQDLIRGHVTHDVPISEGDYAPFAGLVSNRDELGTDIDDYIWWANGDLTFARQQRPISGTNYRPISGDFDASGTDDIFWYQPGAGWDPIWWSNGDRTWTHDNDLLSVNGTYTPVAGDFDNNGATDIIWYRPGAASDPVWWFDGPSRTYTDGTFNISGRYVPLVGNFDNSDGDDILWYNPLRGTANLWWSDGDRTFTHVNGLPVGNYSKPFGGDFDGDGTTDVFWYRPGSTVDAVWWAEGGREFIVEKGPDVQVSGTYAPIVGDFDGDGADDVLWDAVGYTTDFLWSGDAGRVFGRTRTSAYDAFQPIVGKFDEDDATDIFWYDGPSLLAWPTSVVGRHVFFNNSPFDRGNPAANAADDGAVAPDKRALLPGQPATFANYTSYSRGINGVMIDFVDLPGTPTVGDFIFQVGNSDPSLRWRAAPPPQTITVRPGQGDSGTDRVTIIWPDNAIEKEWLKVIVRDTLNTGLSARDVFYFGNAIGESGNSTTDAKVNVYDMLAARDNPRTFLDPAPIDFFVDFNRDQRVNVYDMLIARDNQTSFLDALRLITVPPSGAPGMAAMVEGGPARDAVFRDPGGRPSRRGEILPGRLAWLYEFDPASTDFRPGKEEDRVEEAVNTLPAIWNP